MIPARDDSTRTLAIYAEEQAREVNLGFGAYKKRVNFFVWVGASLIVFGGAVEIGFHLRERVDSYATKEAVAANTEEIERHRAEIAAINARLDGIVKAQTRTLDGVDEVKGILMRERRR